MTQEQKNLYKKFKMLLDQHQITCMDPSKHLLELGKTRQAILQSVWKDIMGLDKDPDINF